jgi:AcrR family transcriptional regulator
LPARIDAEERRTRVVHAAFGLVAAEGIDALSLRRVAAAANLNIGSVRHFFHGHEDLMAAAARDAGDRMARRLSAHPAGELKGLAGTAALDALQELVEQVLPVDADRRAEAAVVLEFVIASRTRPVFAPMAARMAADLREVLAEALTALAIANPETGARQLAAVIGGLTVDAVTPHGAITAAELRATLRAHLSLLVGVEERGHSPRSGPPVRSSSASSSASS